MNIDEWNSLRKNSLSNLCYNIRQQTDSLDAFDYLLQQHAMELEFGEDDSGSPMTTKAPEIDTTFDVKFGAPNLLEAASPISDGSLSSQSDSPSGEDEDASGDDDNGEDDEDASGDDYNGEDDQDASGDDHNGEDDNACSDVDFMVLDSEPSQAADASTATSDETQVEAEVELVYNTTTDITSAEFLSPFPSPTLPHREFSPGPAGLITSTTVAANPNPNSDSDPDPEWKPKSKPKPAKAVTSLHRLARRKRASPPSTSRIHNIPIPVSVSDNENENNESDPGEDDGDEYKVNDSDSDDEEYAPSPSLPSKSRKRGRVSVSTPRSRRRTLTQQKRSTATRSPSASSSSSRPPAKKRRLIPESRNLQSTSAELLELQSLLTTSSSSSSSSSTSTSTTALPSNFTFICPVCGWNQVNKRMPDFQRHLKTHTRPDPNDKTQGFWCKGVRVEDLETFNEQQLSDGDKMIPEDAEQYWFHDHWRVGGCCMQFSRRDALKRHISNANAGCAGPIGKGLEDDS